jgi:hypothetical protein
VTANRPTLETIKQFSSADLHDIEVIGRSVTESINLEKPPKNSQYLIFKLRNDVGENTCFINVVIQNIWHLETFNKTLKRIVRWNREQG